MRGKCKKLITDINRGAELEIKLPEYVRLLGSQYNLYATVKLCLNYYIIKEMILEVEDKDACYLSYFDSVTSLIKKHILDRQEVFDASIEAIKDIRSQIEKKMKVLTSYTDGYEIYEYILNRVEAGIMETVEEVDIERLSAKLYNYIFMENDTVMINSKLQLVMAQLPVRMTKMKFFDILGRTLAIYTGSEKTSADEFADMIRSAVLVKKPEGFVDAYPYLYGIYEKLLSRDYKKLSKDELLEINSELNRAALVIDDEVSIYMLLQEIANALFTILLTVDMAYEDNQTAIGYKSALAILRACIEEDDFEALPENFMTKFIDIEGVQETIYENIMLLESAYDDISSGKSDMLEELGITDSFDTLGLIEKLLSTSLFIDIDSDKTASEEIADSDYINKLKEELIGELDLLFKEHDRLVVRSMMSKLLSAMPVFMNNKQEIKDYFDYVLNNCNDASELTACSKLLNEIMDEE